MHVLLMRSYIQAIEKERNANELKRYKTSIYWEKKFNRKSKKLLLENHHPAEPV